MRGFTAGCWDLMHFGHHRMISIAQSYCTTLTIGVMTDRYCAAKKGPTRPNDTLMVRIKNVRTMFPKAAILILDTDEQVKQAALAHDIFIRERTQTNLLCDHPSEVIVDRLEGISTSDLTEYEQDFSWMTSKYEA